VRLQHSRHYSIIPVIFNVILQYYKFYRIDAGINFWKKLWQKSVFLFQQQLSSKSPKLIYIHGQSLKLMYFNKKFFKTI